MAKDYKADVIIDHREDTDGILEYDNKLPTWWVWMFILTSIAGIYVILDWHVLNDKSLADNYDRIEEVMAERYGELEMIAAVVNDENIAAGAEIFATNCVACHGEAGVGAAVGPDLTDAEWIHGGGLTEINTIIFDGVEGTAMPAWGSNPAVGPQNAANLAAYVHSLGGGVVQ